MSDRTVSTSSRENRARDELGIMLAQAETHRLNFEKLLPSDVSWDVFKDTFKLALQRSPYLLEADRDTLWQSLQKAAMDGLKPDGRECALVVFGMEETDEDGNKVATRPGKKKAVVYMPMVYGLIKMVRNTGNVAGIRARLVYKGEKLEVTDEDGVQSYRHVRAFDGVNDVDDSPQNIIGAYAVVNYKDGTWEMEPMSRRQIERVKAISRAKNGPWGAWYDEMAKKTVLRRLIKGLEKSAVVRIEAAMDRDDTMTIDGDAEPPPARALPAPAKTAAAPEVERQASSRPRDQFDGEILGASQSPAATALAEKLRNPAAAQERHEPAGPAQTSRSAPPVQEVQQQPRQAVAYYPTDDTGEPALEDGAAFESEDAFAEWMIDTLGITERPDALIENNRDALDDLRKVAPKLEDEVDAALMKAQGRLAARAKASEGGDTAQEPEPASEVHEAAAEADDTPLVEVPTTPGGKPHWPNYADACGKAIRLLTTEAEIIDWQGRNFPTYQGKAIEAAVDKRVREHRQRLEDAAALPERDNRAAEGFIADIAACASLNDLAVYAGGVAFKTVRARWKTDRPDLWQRITAAGDAREAELTAA